MTYTEIKNFHSSMLGSVTAHASRSPAYEGLGTISDVTRLNELPLTTYTHIQGCFERLGVEKVLLSPSARFWHTSGSTGKPKNVYYGQRDLDEIALALFQLLYLCGARPWNNAWVFTASGGETLFGLVVDRYGLDGTISELAGEMDMIKALREASKLEKIDVLVGVTWLYLLMDKIVKDPKDFEELVAGEVKKRVKVPGLSGLVAKYLLRGIDYARLGRSLQNARLGFSHAEALSPYLPKIREVYPNLQMHDVFGATEQWVQAIQVSPEKNWLSFFLRYSIPEIAPPEEILRGKEDRGYRVKGVPWFEWEKGLKGELILTRPNECLPLVRYPTGDLVEVMDPAFSFEVELERGKLEITLPAIKALGRAADSVDFEGADESGNFLGFKVYSRQINDALMGIKNVRWWELYHVKGSPGRFVFLIIPEGTVSDEATFRGEILRSLVNMFDEFTAATQGRAFLVGGTAAIEDQRNYLDLMITRPSAYGLIDAEIKRRIREGRTMGQLKPKRVYVVDNDEALATLTREKMEA
jgi:phenylacetate-coenzyme A ligase PaaK-like adenylate-forming protein